MTISASEMEDSGQKRLYVVSANDNLLERFGLIVQNSTVLTPSASSAPETLHATTILASTKSILSPTHHCQPCPESQFKWVVLVAKEWEPTILDCLSDICRLALAQSNKGAEILVIKKDAFPTDFDILNEHIDSSRRQWTNEWTSQLDKYKRLGESNARSEHLQKLEGWVAPGCPLRCSLAHVDDQDLAQQIADFFRTHHGVLISEGVVAEEHKSTLFTKPPALHWTHFPREAEMQVSFKFTFPQGSVPEKTFRRLTSTARQSFSGWEYEYEWTNGILLRQQLVKVTVVRSIAHVIEVSGRIDKDEAAEEEEEGEGGNGDRPMARVWPYLARVLDAFVKAVNRIQSLPYTPFFNCPDGARIVTSRSLDAIQTLSAIQRTSSVRFKVLDQQEHIYSLDLDQSFPGPVKPTRLADFNPTHFSLAEAAAKVLPATTASELPPTCNSLGLDNHSSDPESMRLPSPHNLQVERQLSAHKNRGRRVSFGAIRAIPTLDGSGGSGSAGGCTSPLLMGLTNHRPPVDDGDEEEKGEKQTLDNSDGEVQSSTVVDTYVDDMLQQTIDQVLVMD